MSYIDQITVGSTTYDIQDSTVPAWARASNAPQSLPSGGTTGQVLTKTSDSDYAAAWSSLSLDDVYSVVASDTEPTDEHVNGWIDTSLTIVENVPQIDDTQTSLVDTFSSSKIASTYVTFDQVYPVGAIYMSVDSTSPASLFGGTWEQIQDTFLLAAGSTYSAGSTGGSATKDLQHKHTTSGHKLVESEIPKISGSFSNRRWYTGAGILNLTGKFTTAYSGTEVNPYTADNTRTSSPQKITFSFGGDGSHSHGDTGNNLSTTQDIMPPYLAIYVWKRVA